MTAPRSGGFDRDHRGPYGVIHGHAAIGNGTLTYRFWQQMRRRCLYKKHWAYKNYGGRGITFCKRWEDFALFLADMGERPSLKHSIDRINNDGNYEPGNCRWITNDEQAKNHRRSRLLTLDGKTQCLSDWSRALGITESGLRKRLQMWPLERALKESKHEQ